MKIFISQPMMGKSDELIAAERKLIIERVKSMYGNDVEILDSLFNDYNTSNVFSLIIKLSRFFCKMSKTLILRCFGQNQLNSDKTKRQVKTCLLELLTGLEPVTSSLPRMCSTT